MPKTDLFVPIRSEADLHPQFRNLRTSPMHAPARSMMRALYADFSDPDGNFLEQLQTTGFDARTFELYLYAFVREQGWKIDRQHSRPDFCLEKNGTKIFIEATTANPPGPGTKPYTLHVPDRDLAELRTYLANEVPIRLGSSLFSKLQKQYWELAHVAGHPLVFAIESFHGPGSLSHSSSSLASYLFGLAQRWYHDNDGRLIITPEQIDGHRIPGKEIPSGFFFQPDTQHISAVLFSNSGTVPKFNRMGQEGEYHSDAVRMIRYGTCYRDDPNATLPAPFLYEVGDGEWKETWREGTDLIHNPNALHPISIGLLGAGAEQRLENGRIVTQIAEPFHPYGSLTMNFPGHISTRSLQKIADRISERLAELLPM